MLRWIAVAVLHLGLVASLASPVLAQDASPGASPVAGELPLDLPAMALLPQDLDNPDFFLESGWFNTAEGMAEFYSTRHGLPVFEVLGHLRAAGYSRRYHLYLVRRMKMTRDAATPESVPNRVDQRIATFLGEYASAEGAAAGFDFLERQLEARDDAFQDIPLTTPIGDEAELTRWSGVHGPTGTPLKAVSLTFRTDNLVAEVSITDWMNQEPNAAEVEALAVKLQDRIEEVRATGAPGLSNRLIRLEGGVGPEGYLVREGVPISYFVVSGPSIELIEGATFWAIDVYQSVLDVGTVDELDLALYRAATAEAASTWLAERPLTLLEAEEGYVDVEEIFGVAVIGEESRVFSYTLPEDRHTVGYGVFTRVGDVVAGIEVATIQRVPLAAVLELAEAQAQCLVVPSCWEPIAFPEAHAAAEPASQASPSATPAA